MKYFTPDLIRRFGSEDPEIADKADAEWEEGGERYAAYLKAVETQLPPGIKQLHDHYYLHDAVVFSMGRQDGRFVMVLRLDTPPRDFLILTYDLWGEPVIREDILPLEHRCKTQVEWMYDEVEPGPEGAPQWMQSILFSNGWEVCLPFSDIHVQPMRSVLPLLGPVLASTTATKLPQSA
jgi:hypothetical protein